MILTSESYRQVLNALRERPNLSDCSLRVLHLAGQEPAQRTTKTARCVKRELSVYIQSTSSPVQACQGHPHRSGAQSLSGSSVPLASPHPSDRRTPHSHPAFSSSDCQSYQMKVFWAGVKTCHEKKKKRLFSILESSLLLCEKCLPESTGICSSTHAQELD